MNTGTKIAFYAAVILAGLALWLMMKYHTECGLLPSARDSNPACAKDFWFWLAHKF